MSSSSSSSEEETLIAALQTNPYEAETFSKLITLLRARLESGNEEDENQGITKESLQQYREMYTLNCCPEMEFWLDWINDQISSSTASKDDLNSLDVLFKRAMHACPHESIIKAYVENANHRLEAELMNEDEVRMVLEHAISICGGDVVHGSHLWTTLVELELSELEDLMETSASPESIRKAKEAVVQTFRRQFSLPLLGNNTALKSLETVLSEICVSSDVEWIKPDLLLEKYKRSEEQLTKVILYEQKVTSDEFKSLSLDEKVASWKVYIKVEMDDNNLTRVQRLYERALLVCQGSMELWKEYLDFAENVIKQWSIVDVITERAVKIFRHVIHFWELRLLAMETVGTSTKASSGGSTGGAGTSSAGLSIGGSPSPSNPIERYQALEISIDSAISLALTCSFPSADDYLLLLLYRCDFHRRKLQQYVAGLSPSSSSRLTLTSQERNQMLQATLTAVATVRSMFDQAEEIVHAYYPEWGVGWLQLYKYRVAVEDELIGDVAAMIEELSSGNDTSLLGINNITTNSLQSEAGKIWERAVARFAKYGFIWQEFIRWARSTGDFPLCRGLYQRSLKMVKDCPEELCRSYLVFEAQIGTVEDLHTAKGLTKKLLKAAALLTAKIMAKEAAAVAAAAAASSGNREERRAAASAGKGKEGKKPMVNGGASASGTRASVATNGNGTTNGMTGSSGATSSGAVVSIKPGLGYKNGNEVTSEVVGGKRNVNEMQGQGLEGLDDGTAREGNAEGETKRPRISAASHDGEIQMVMAAEDQIAGSSSAGGDSGDGMITEPTEATQPPKKIKGVDNPNHHPTTVYVSKLPLDMTKDKFWELFGDLGTVVEAKINYDKKTGASKGHGLIQFADAEGKKAALNYNKRDLRGHVLSILPSKFAAIVDGATATSSSSSSHNGTTSSSFSSSSKDTKSFTSSTYGPKPTLPLSSSSSSSTGDTTTAPTGAKEKPTGSLLQFRPRGIMEKKPRINL